jgi:excisionase family DNA binding protein
MATMTTSEAAQVLGVSRRRVLALIQSGDLAAERFGSSWAVSEDAVRRRVASPRLKGRPPMGVREPQCLERYTLMCRDHEVAAFCYDRALRRVGSVRELGGAAWAPPGACGVNGRVHPVNLNAWVCRRYIPHTREGLADLLRAAGCEHAADLMFGSLGLNLSDQYWFKPEGSTVVWHDVNYFENPYVDRQRNAGFGASERVAYGPGTSTDGQVLKWWERRGSADYLVKGSTAYDHEPYAELLASRLYARLLDPGDFVPYELEERDGAPYSVCPCFIGPSTELVTLADLECRYGSGYPLSRYEAYARLLETNGVEGARTSLAKMLVCDYLTANMDRHEGNLGVVLNVEDRSFAGVAPLYDNGRGFYFGARRPADLEDGLFRYVSNPFAERPSAQLALVEDYAWFDADALEGFAAEVEEVFSRNDRLPSWFASAAARQFERRLARVVEASQE